MVSEFEKNLTKVQKEFEESKEHAKNLVEYYDDKYKLQEKTHEEEILDLQKDHLDEKDVKMREQAKMQELELKEKSECDLAKQAVENAHEA